MTNDIHGSIRRSGPAWRASVAGRAPAAHCPKVRCRPLRRGHRLATNLRRMPRGVHLEGERLDEAQAFEPGDRLRPAVTGSLGAAGRARGAANAEIGRAACREREWRYG